MTHLQGEKVPKSALLIKSQVWEKEADRYAAIFSEDQIKAAVGIVAQLEPTNPGGFLASMLGRWAESPTDREADIARLQEFGNGSGRRYKQGQFSDFWDA